MSTNKPTSKPDDLVWRAIEKRHQGKRLTQRESRAFTKWKKEQDEADRDRLLSAVPKKWYRTAAGRGDKVLNEQADRYGVPCRGRTVNIAAIVRWYHDFIAANTHALRKTDQLADDDDDSDALERWREEKFQMARLDRLERQRTLLNRADVHDSLNRLAAILRGVGEQLGQRFGPDAQDLLGEGLDAFQREIDAQFVPDPDDGG